MKILLFCLSLIASVSCSKNSGDNNPEPITPKVVSAIPFEARAGGSINVGVNVTITADDQLARIILLKEPNMAIADIANPKSGEHRMIDPFNKYPAAGDTLYYRIEFIMKAGSDLTPEPYTFKVF